MVSPTTTTPTQIILTNLNENKQHENDDNKNDDDDKNDYNNVQQQQSTLKELHDNDVTSERINCTSNDDHEFLQKKPQQESIDSHPQLEEQLLLSLTINDEGKIVMNNDDNNNQVDDDHHHPLHFICDLSYGLPKEIRPRQEKLNAIAKQLINFVSWQQQQQQEQQQQQQEQEIECLPLGKMTIVTRSSSTTASTSSTSEIIQELLLKRMKIIWKQQHNDDIEFPIDRIVFTNQTLEEIHEKSNCCINFQNNNNIDNQNHNINSKTTTIQSNENSHILDSSLNFVYLSPDSPNILNIYNNQPPRILVIGLLIDRKQIQYNRSYERAIQSSIPTARLPIDNIMMLTSDDDDNRNTKSSSTTTKVTTANSSSSSLSHRLHPNEPLNVDCILEAMQQWDWNCYNMLVQKNNQTETTSQLSGDDSSFNHGTTTITNDNQYSKCYYDAFEQAMKHHCERHPGRPFHL